MTHEDMMLGWLGPRLESGAFARLMEERERLRRGPVRAALFRVFDLAAGLAGKAPLDLTPAELIDAAALEPGWNPAGWTRDQAARLAMVLTAARLETSDAFLGMLDTLFATADMSGLVALYQGLPLYPMPERLVGRAQEGVRNSIVPVFQAVAHRNAFPARHFAEGPWNQMVLKAVFLDIRLDPITGLDERANPRLAAMLLDYVRERRAAGRDVPWDLWRCVDPFADMSPAAESGEPS
jgi:hypothetical protein